MITPTRRARWVAAPVALALAAASLGPLTAPATAAQTAFSSTTDILFGDDDYTLSQTTHISLPGGPSTAPGSPYPSQITMPHGALIEDLDVSLNVSHDFPDDIDVLLVGPGGRQALIMSDAGGGTAVAAVNLTLDDEAAAPLADDAPLTSGVFQPSDYVGAVDDDNFELPAPPATGTSILSVFDATSAAGTWRLYVRDDFPGEDDGTINSWSLDFDLATTPYPSTINVSGVPPVSDVNVTFDDLTTTFPDDADVLLVGPGGQQVMLMSDAGGSDDVNDLDLVFDDEATASLPDATPITAGTYKPTNIGAVDTAFPGPAPALSGNVLLSAFDGLNPNGAWRLFAVDDRSPDLVELSGWSLGFTLADVSSPSGTVNVNAGATTTTSRNVTLNLTASDPSPSSGVTRMRFSNDGATFSAYQPLAATAAWTLSAGEGTKTVYAQFRDSAGNQSAVASDTVTLDLLGPRGTRTKPSNKAKNVTRTTKVKVKANEDLAAGTVNKNTVILRLKGGPKVKAKVTYRAAKKMIVLIPKEDLERGSTYKVKVKRAVKDLSGHGWDQFTSTAGSQPLKFRFRTA
jgi:subtilisin-like proprotein convertase family protein